MTRAPSAEELVRRMAAREQWRLAALREYEVMRRYRVTAARLTQEAAMGVRVNYSYPGRKNFEVLWETGSRLLQKRVMQKLIDAELEAARDDIREQARISPDNYDFRMLGSEVCDGRPCYLLELEPRKRGKFAMRGRIWVDLEDAAVVRLEGAPLNTGSFWVRSVHMVQTYKKVGQFWLVDSNRTESEVRLFGPARLSIEYYGYRVNGADMEPASARR